VYGGFFWLNGDGALPAPRDAYYMSGVAGQRTLMVPSHELVIVRLGHSSGEASAEAAFARCVAQALTAIPATLA
jgi:CubicO group peptidase (beta-lactamase class C family)